MGKRQKTSNHEGTEKAKKESHTTIATKINFLQLDLKVLSSEMDPAKIRLIR
jgi:hypothetical protein